MPDAKTSAPAPPIIDTAQLDAQLRGLAGASAVWLHTHWLQILIATAVGTAIVFVLHALRHLAARLCDRDKGPEGWGTIIGHTIVRTNNVFIVMLAARLVVGFAGAPVQVANTVAFAWTVASVFQAAIWARELILGAIVHRTNGQDNPSEALLSAMGLIRLLVTLALFAIALVVVLDNLGVNVTGLVAGLGVGGIAIGLAAQGIFADLFAALAIIFDRPFRRGDLIGYDNTSGTVERIGLKSTRIRGINGEERIIANKQLLDKEIQNNTKRDRRRLKFTLGLAYETPVQTLRDVPAMLRETVEANACVFVRSGFVTFADSTLDFELEFDSPHADYANAYEARHSIGLAILERFNMTGIKMPFPIRVAYTATPDGQFVAPYPDAQTVRLEGPPAR